MACGADSRKPQSSGAGWEGRFFLRRWRRVVTKTIRRHGWPGGGTWVPVTGPATDLTRYLAASAEENTLQIRKILPKVLLGRALTPQELQRALDRAGVKVTAYLFTIALQELILAGKVDLVAAVGLDRWGRFYCRRCAGTNAFAQST